MKVSVISYSSDKARAEIVVKSPTTSRTKHVRRTGAGSVYADSSGHTYDLENKKVL